MGSTLSRCSSGDGRNVCLPLPLPLPRVAGFVRGFVADLGDETRCIAIGLGRAHNSFRARSQIVTTKRRGNLRSTGMSTNLAGRIGLTKLPHCQRASASATRWRRRGRTDVAGRIALCAVGAYNQQCARLNRIVRYGEVRDTSSRCFGIRWPRHNRGVTKPPPGVFTQTNLISALSWPHLIVRAGLCSVGVILFGCAVR